MPQIASPRRIIAGQVNLGLFLILLGYFKKVVVADNLAKIADPVFGNYFTYHGMDIFIGVMAFSIQIYCDFSGYSNIARGLAKLLGIELMVNFRLPYFAVNPQDFWRRWHISLSTWLRDYLYIPLGGSRQGRLLTHRNLGITMLLCGLWHGAAWNFLIWGSYHWMVLSIYRMFLNAKIHFFINHTLKLVLSIATMFCINLVGWIIFRSNSLEQIFYMLGHMGLNWSQSTEIFLERFLFFTFPLIALELWQYLDGNLAAPAARNVWIRSLIYGLSLAAIIMYGVRESVEFIYFQF
ncbi:MAG: MBOAT family O-acyltransferase [Planctomycetota bacterium]